MTDIEFDIIDELYFIQDFDYLKASLDLPVEDIIKNLESLIEKEWVKCFWKDTDEPITESIDLKENVSKIKFLATKKGLMIHNGMGNG